MMNLLQSGINFYLNERDKKDKEFYHIMIHTHIKNKNWGNNAISFVKDLYKQNTMRECDCDECIPPCKECGIK